MHQYYILIEEKYGLGGLLARLLWVVYRGRFETIVSLLVGPNLIALIVGRLAGARRIVWGNRVSTFDKREFGLKGELVQFFQKRLSKYVSVIVSNTNEGQQVQKAQGIKGKNNIVIYNGIDISRFVFDSYIRKAVRLELGINPNTLVIGTVARIVEWKGYDTFLEAAALFEDVNPDVLFLCVGDGESNVIHRYKKLALSYGIQEKVAWLGDRRDVHRILCALDIFTLASLRGEGFSNSVAEAMATSRPVVVTDVGGSRRLVGDGGFVVRPGKTDELVQKLELLNSRRDLLEGYGLRGRDRIRNHFSVERMVEETIETFSWA